MPIQTHIASAGDSGRRIDLLLTTQFGRSRSQWQRLIKSGEVTVNGQSVKPNYTVEAGDNVTVNEPQTTYITPIVPVLYEDQYLLVVDKPAGLLVHPTPTSNEATLSLFSALRSKDPDKMRPGVVHRLDRDTSGVLVLAKDTKTKDYLQQQFKDRKVHKTYLALVSGRLKQPEARIDLPIGRSLRNPAKRAVSPLGRPAITNYSVAEELPGYTLVLVEPTTGRTHQIRVHLSHLGHPVVGDTLYGQPDKQLPVDRQFLHATSIELVGPDGKLVKVESPLPPDLAKTLNRLRKSV